MCEACRPHSGQQALGEDEIKETCSSLAEALTRSTWSPSDKGRKGDPSILLHRVLHKSHSLENNEKRDFNPYKQAGTLTVVLVANSKIRLVLS
jgi:hypothetical protein